MWLLLLQDLIYQNVHCLLEIQKECAYNLKHTIEQVSFSQLSFSIIIHVWLYRIRRAKQSSQKSSSNKSTLRAVCPSARAKLQAAHQTSPEECSLPKFRGSCTSKPCRFSSPESYFHRRGQETHQFKVAVVALRSKQISTKSPLARAFFSRVRQKFVARSPKIRSKSLTPQARQIEPWIEFCAGFDSWTIKLAFRKLRERSFFSFSNKLVVCRMCVVSRGWVAILSVLTVCIFY